MSESLESLLNGNKAWAEETRKNNPQLFEELSKGQSPEFLWIGCSDSRVPATKVTNTNPGSIFVHRNIANMVIPTDLNLLSVVNYAVVHLKVKHVIVCGHYGCGGVKAAMGNDDLGILNSWLQHIKNVYNDNVAELDAISNEDDKFNRMVELNVAAQVKELSKISFIQDQWKNGEYPHIHGCVYNLSDGEIKNLDISVNSTSQLGKVHQYS